MIVKLSLSSLDSTGRVVGRIQAAATAGSIAGVFLTGFALISWFGTRAIVAGVVVLLLLLAALSHPYLTDTSKVAKAVRRQPALGIVPVVVLVAALGLAMSAKSQCIKESNYFCIDVGPDQTGQYRELRLDLLIHGIVNPQNPAELIYPYEKLYQQVTESTFPKRQNISSFQIGGGTYSFPRYLAANYDAKSLVAEIDPAVTEVARSELGLKDSPEIIIRHRDARMELNERPDSERYDLVLGDAFNDIAVPYHLTTKEFNEKVADHLSPRGLYLVNVVDGKDYDFLRSFIDTLTKTFQQRRADDRSGTGGAGRARDLRRDRGEPRAAPPPDDRPAGPAAPVPRREGHGGADRRPRAGRPAAGAGVRRQPRGARRRGEEGGE